MEKRLGNSILNIEYRISNDECRTAKILCRGIYPLAGRLAIALLLCIFALLTAPNPLLAQEAEIKDCIVTNSSTDLLLFFTVSNAFSPEIEEGIHNGIPVTFTLFVELSRTRKGWVDREEVSITFDHTMTYDNLKEEYQIKRAGNGLQAVTSKSLDKARILMTEINGFKVFPLSKLVPDAEYTLRVRARLAKKTLPFYFHYLIPFGSLWDFKTDWHTTEFRY